MEKATSGDEPPDYDHVEPGYHRTLPHEERQEWVTLVADPTGKLPAEWWPTYSKRQRATASALPDASETQSSLVDRSERPPNSPDESGLACR